MARASDNRELSAPGDAHRLDKDALTEYLAARVPGFSGPCTIKQFLGGQSNPTSLIRAASGSYVLRKKPPGDLLPSAHAVDREFKVMSALAATDVPVPHMHLLCQDNGVIGQMFYIMDYVPGRVVSHPTLPDCAPAERDAMYHRAARVLGLLHSVDYESVGLRQFGKPSGYVARQVARWSKQYEASKIEDCDEMDQLIAWLPRNNPDDEQASIVHGDFRPGNLIFDNHRHEIVAVLDWELSTIGHPLADLAYFLMPHYLPASPQIYGLKGLNLASLGIPSQQPLLETYVQSTGRNDVPGISFYVAFSMFRLAAILAGVLKRGINGNAADPRAVERGRTYREIAAIGWAIATSQESSTG
jgi:aminoglycoside phosphotransferase (APT) family kinase protein